VLLARPRHGPVVAGKLSDYALHLYAARAMIEHLGAVTRESLGDRHPMVGYIPDLLYSPELRFVDDLGPLPAPTLRSSSINAQARLIATGAGIGVLPHFIGGGTPDLVRVLPEVTIHRTFWLVTHRDTRQLRRVRAFSAWLGGLVTKHHARLDPPR
jgi:DNA-binding transcriptional LysR family regulator